MMSRTGRRALAAALVALVVLSFVTAHATLAQTEGAALSFEPNFGGIGDTIAVTGTGFLPSKTIALSYLGVPLVTTPAKVISDASGTFTASFVIMAKPAGGMQIEANDGTNTFSDYITVSAAAAITPTGGIVGSQVKVSATGFSASTQVTVTFESAQIATLNSDPVGNLQGTFTVPDSGAGNHTVSLNDGGISADSTFVTRASATVDPASAKVGAQVSLKGHGYGANQHISIYFDNRLVSETTARSNGSFDVNVAVPAVTAGSRQLTATDGNNFVSNKVVVLPVVSAMPSLAHTGGSVTVAGNGFGAEAPVLLKLGDTELQTVNTDANGSFSVKFKVPALDEGAYQLTASAGSLTASAPVAIAAGSDSNGELIVDVVAIAGGIVVVVVLAVVFLRRRAKPS